MSLCSIPAPPLERPGTWRSATRPRRKAGSASLTQVRCASSGTRGADVWERLERSGSSAAQLLVRAGAEEIQRL